MAFLGWLRSKWSPRYRAYWLYQRGVFRAKAGLTSQAIQDYCDVIDIAQTPPSVRAMARYNWALLLWASGEQEQAHQELTNVLEDAGAPERVKAEARRKILRISRSSERSDPIEK
ncbi:hypothetical protein Pan181_42300 [Aeoliella mucimassa]|uniref:Tetratricopeptide repeat protein n=1 Tax=Aeoliella mucimassa TaxID=2527972 RepID=A0A518ATG8_9BACT|nr:hypothetical protein Pan181_42300 [Aeoliella mucimassa]